MDFSTLLDETKNNVVLLIGNGINRYHQTNNENSWTNLLLTLWNLFNSRDKTTIPKGLSLAEFYDIMELRYLRNGFHLNLQEEFCKQIGNWNPTVTHYRITQWAKTHEVPILTTNFDENLNNAGNCKLFYLGENRMSDYYPWDRYFSNKKLINIENGFGIWHMHGMKRYPRSLRLGLTHYLGAVGKVRGWINGGQKKSLYNQNFNEEWIGSSSWVHLIFSKPIIIFGLGLDSNEVFLRWLLIERRKYFLKYPSKEKKAWYIHPKTETDIGKLLFLKYVGVETLKTETLDDIYLTPWN
ncbi:MAG: hypothetical protein AB9897_02330 [Anaerolineaceae bacterium]